MVEPELFRRIREELKRAVLLLLDQLRRDHPDERVCAILFEVDLSGTYAIRIAGTEESLTRLAEKYITEGYRAKSGDLLGHLRALLRWDAPGDDKDGWYWGNQKHDAKVTRLIDQAVKADLIEDYGDEPHLRTLCLDALRELDKEGRLGPAARESGYSSGPLALRSASARKRTCRSWPRSTRHVRSAGCGASCARPRLLIGR